MKALDVHSATTVRAVTIPAHSSSVPGTLRVRSACIR